ncbi:TolB family protein [Albibacterium profundi]|uniref:WD40-like Beta Propeller Repeat n=1 Tax=Albibacterium profundi TaxID=3134906 RepID=A0ABV5CB85_9SPHI
MQNLRIKRIGCFLMAFFLLASGCKESDPNIPEKSGTLYYSSANELIKYDFRSKQEVSLFSGGDNYRISEDAKRFLWYKNNFTDGITQVQVHNLQTPSEYQTITVPLVIEHTPQFVIGETSLFAALARAEDEPINRTDLVFFNDNNQINGRIPHVKSFVFLPNGNDIILSAEALNAQGEPIGYALALLKNYQSETDQQSIVIHEYPDYAQLPEGIAVSPNGRQIVFTQSDHLYTANTQENGTPKQLTQSRFREIDAAWSPDGQSIIFTANVSGVAECGEIRIIPAHPNDPIPVPEDGVNNKPVDPLQPLDSDGEVIHACASESFIWL